LEEFGSAIACEIKKIPEVRCKLAVDCQDAITEVRYEGYWAMAETIEYSREPSRDWEHEREEVMPGQCKHVPPLKPSFFSQNDFGGH